jgi:glyoxylase-like metal-dependent hydrolase (beta-lactamase superfamily II)
MRLGELEFQLITDGTFRLDGGAMFGVIPKPLWERKSPADERNRILLAMNILLVRAAGKWILIETGAGDKWDAKRKQIYGFENGPRLLDKLAAVDVPPEKIDIVINTHLHFDHCGWNTRIVNGKARPTFPNALYITQRGEYEHALAPTERDQASYLDENYVPVRESGQFQLLEADAEVVPGVKLVVVPGHTRHMQCVLLTGGGKTVFLPVDLTPTAAHLPYPWIMGYDLYPMETLENKKTWLRRAASEGWTIIFAHDPHTPAVRLIERQGNIEAEPVTLD